MTLFHLHDDFAAPASERRFTLARAFTWLAAALRTIHTSIVAAKTRRLERELMFHGDFGDEMLDKAVADQPLVAEDVAKLPQRPMILGDKWDF
jgi:hypothetical protein